MKEAHARAAEDQKKQMELALKIEDDNKATRALFDAYGAL